MSSAEHAPTRPVPTKATLLIVDDSAENVAVLGHILMPDYQIRVASSGQRALSMARTEPVPDLILLDVMMPVMDGYEVLQCLRDDPAMADIPVIFVTALNDATDEAKGFALGAADYITKPIRPAIVKARIRAQLELKEARSRMKDQNQWLEAEVERRINQNMVVQDVALRALASLAEIRDNETGAHILRTQNYVRLLAEKLAETPDFSASLSAQTIHDYARAAPLHDIGKVGIPDAILQKPGRLTPAEWEVMKTHAKLGSDAIWNAIAGVQDRSALDFLCIAMDIARCHHERWDGSGYPEGLSGDGIPLPARLMALADVFDAMISRRVYKDPIDIDATKAAIIAGSGTHFDPRIVNAFEACFEGFLTIAARFPDSQT